MKKYIVRLTEAQRQDLQHLISAGKEPARRLLHARVLLKADQGANGPGWTDEHISEALEVSTSTLVRVRRVFAEQGLPGCPHAAFTQSDPPPTLGWGAGSPLDCPGLLHPAGWA